MKQRQQTGFTVIEVVLFLAISASLAIVLMIGTSAAIQRQQYRDSVQSYASFLRDQYSKVLNVENSRSNTEPCPISNSAVVPRGQSNCVIIGRYIETSGEHNNSSGGEYDAYPVYGIKDGKTWRYSLGDSKTSYAVNWGVKTRLSNQAEKSANIAILMYRDPETGSLAVRVNNGHYNTRNIGDFFKNQDAYEEAREVCVYDRGWFVGERQSVFLSSRAGSADSVAIKPATKGCSDA